MLALLIGFPPAVMSHYVLVTLGHSVFWQININTSLHQVGTAVAYMPVYESVESCLWTYLRTFMRVMAPPSLSKQAGKFGFQCRQKGEKEFIFTSVSQDIKILNELQIPLSRN